MKIKQYEYNHVLSESPARLTEILYEGILRFLGGALRCIETKDVEGRVFHINKSVDIFTELLNTLDYDLGGETADYLSGLYTHQIKLLIQANLENSSEKIFIVIKVVRSLLEAWRDVHSAHNTHDL